MELDIFASMFLSLKSEETKFSFTPLKYIRCPVLFPLIFCCLLTLKTFKFSPRECSHLSSTRGWWGLPPQEGILHPTPLCDRLVELCGTPICHCLSSFDFNSCICSLFWLGTLTAESWPLHVLSWISVAWCLSPLPYSFKGSWRAQPLGLCLCPWTLSTGWASEETREYSMTLWGAQCWKLQV